MLLPTVYEDAGLSGGTLERPGLQRLLADIDAGLVEQIVVYKVDRLTRSLSDFAKLVERLEAAGAVFVSSCHGLLTMRNTYIVSYDISDSKRLRRVFKTLRNWGDHLQFSVFECQLSRMDLVVLRTPSCAKTRPF